MAEEQVVEDVVTDSTTVTDEVTANDLAQAEIKRLRNEAAGTRRKLRDLEAKFEGVDTDEYKTMLTQKEEIEKRKLEDKGNYEQLLAESTRRSEAQLQKAQETGSSWKTRYEKQVVDNVLISAASSSAINAQEAVTLLRSEVNFQVTDSGDVEILGRDGQVVLTENGTPATPKEVTASFLAKRPYLCKPVGGGTGSSGGSAPRSKQSNGIDETLRGASRIAAALRERG